MTASPRRHQHRLDYVDLSVLMARGATRPPAGGRDPESATSPRRTSPVVFLHGIPTGAELWREVLERMAAAGYDAYAPDLPGYGLTRMPLDADFSLSGAAEVVAAWLRDGVAGPPARDGAWIVGHDLGGGVAQILAVRHPDLVGRLTLTNSVVADSWPVRPVRLLRGLALARLYTLLVRRRLADNPYTRHELRRLFHDPGRLDGVDVARIFWDGKVAGGRQAFAAHLRALDNTDTLAVADDLAGLDVPVQVVWGMADGFQPFDTVGTRLVDLLADPTVATLAECGHLTPLECPTRLTRRLVKWGRSS